jgi:hypothetical protein
MKPVWKLKEALRKQKFNLEQIKKDPCCTGSGRGLSCRMRGIFNSQE